MKEAGVFMMILACAIAVYALSLDVTVSPGFASSSRVVNFHLVSQQFAVMLGAVALFIGGTVLCGCGQILQHLSVGNDSRNVQAADETEREASNSKIEECVKDEDAKIESWQVWVFVVVVIALGLGTVFLAGQ